MNKQLYTKQNHSLSKGTFVKYFDEHIKESFKNKSQDEYLAIDNKNLVIYLNEKGKICIGANCTEECEILVNHDIILKEILAAFAYQRRVSNVGSGKCATIIYNRIYAISEQNYSNNLRKLLNDDSHFIAQMI